VPSGADRPPPGQGFLRVLAREGARNVPLAGAEILVRLRAGARSETRPAIAGARGEFRLALLPGSYSATFETGGFRPARADFIINEDGPAAAVEVSFQRGISAEGTVRDRDGRPAPGVALDWVRADGGGRRETTADEKGEFRIDGLEAGTYTVSLAPSLLRSIGKVGARKLAVRERETNRFDLQADVGPSLPIEVVDADNRPLSGVQVRFGVVVEGRAASGFLPPTDDAGRTRGPGLPSGCGPLALEVPPGPAGMARVEIDPAARPEGVRLVLRPAPSLDGVAVDEEARPVEGAEVSLLDPGGKTLAAARSDSSGRFQLHGAPSGRRRLRAVAPSRGLAAIEDLQVPAASPEPIVLRLGKSMAIAGSVRDRRGKPVAGARVVLSRAEGREEAIPDRDGNFAFAVEAGKTCSLAASAEGFPVSAALESVRPGKPVELVLSRGAAIRGRIVLPDGSPLRAGADLVISGGPRRSPEPKCKVSPDGSFSVEGLQPGKFRLKAIGPDFALALSDELEVAGEEEVAGAVLRAMDGPALEVQVLDEEAAGISGAILSITGRGERSLIAAVRTADARGGARFPFLPEGEYALRVEAAGHGEEVVPLEWSRSVALPLVVEMRSSSTGDGGSPEKE
jgi:hypothetical protein